MICSVFHFYKKTQLNLFIYLIQFFYFVFFICLLIFFSPFFFFLLSFFFSFLFLLSLFLFHVRVVIFFWQFSLTLPIFFFILILSINWNSFFLFYFVFQAYEIPSFFGLHFNPLILLGIGTYIRYSSTRLAIAAKKNNFFF